MSGGKCHTFFDSFYFISLIFVFSGLVWLLLFRRYFERLQDLPLSAFLVTKDNTLTDQEKKEKTIELQAEVKYASSVESL
jgi:hypothetical protein